ncbi:MAG TPA: hypothetical protein VG843_06305 [Rhizomicrobium sp.]|jgi:catechol 2,3-dioxygenase-like lactoylglutathione lyase family enzyme|nr:hypothetical protein [Rhizomicrobium sp.]
MIIGGHVMIQSRDDAADRAFFRDVLGLGHVEAGEGFLIFALPESEFAVHDSSNGDGHELFLMVEDMDAFAKAMREAGVSYTPPANRGWGTLTSITLPGGGRLGVYQPHHARPRGKPAKTAKKKVAARKSPAARSAGKGAARVRKRAAKTKTRRR